MDQVPRPLDAAGMWYELGRETQAVALVMRRHRAVAEQQLCACGRLTVHAVPAFGLRCDVAYRQWMSTFATMRAMTREAAVPERSVGRVRGPGRERRS